MLGLTSPNSSVVQDPSATVTRFCRPVRAVRNFGRCRMLTDSGSRFMIAGRHIGINKGRFVLENAKARARMDRRLTGVPRGRGYSDSYGSPLSGFWIKVRIQHAHFYKYCIHLCMEYCCYSWSGTPGDSWQDTEKSLQYNLFWPGISYFPST